MGEVDFQMALLLQYKFDQEKMCLSDSQLAKSLQEQYEKECAVEKPVQNLVYTKSNQRTTRDSTKSLTDPSWEVIDPTPDIHVLFMAFNERFFWNKLLAVCVSWSKRMTSCAGICSYNGRGGMCSITLSEPLLKLRPRKDLVETLLHEMIHAFLFITHNNRDRDGHGPEFHKHMFRINAEAGTNITVYHDFHDEVNLYKQHWWRCNGPCQKWKPFFGMVRRAMNRAPGPTDRWWGKHSMDCGGSFLKVKEPEKPGKTTKSQPAGKTKQDIRNFIPTIDKKSSDTRLNNISTISTNNSDTKIETVIPKSSNIFGFTNSNGGSSSSSSTSKSNGDGGGGLRGSVRNNSSTVFITKKPSTLTKVEIVNPKPAVTAGRTTSEPQQFPNQDYSVVRNHWTNKFPVKSGIKRHSKENDTSSEKMPKLSLPSFECPICNKKISEELLNTHIDDCLGKNDPQKCIICEISVPTSEYQAHIGKCAEEGFKDDVFEETGTEPSKKIPSPRKNSEGEEFSEVDKGDEQCEVCDKKISVKEYPTHVNECFHRMFNNIEAKYDNGRKEETTDCLACGDKILKSELNSHLEDCLSMSKIFDDENEPIAPETNDKETNKDKYNCPLCTNLFTKEAMSDHIDECLGIVDLCKS